ncbi:MAG TPA: head GIN domain-containing protein [Ferruginibacter sp.]|nr:head GIN domain-containing protein [Ferruginibacter sp.]
MKKITSVLVFIMIACTGFGQDRVVVDPNAEIRVVNGTFNKIKVSNGIDLYLSQSSTPGIAISASEEKFKARIKTVIENNVLKIYFEDDNAWKNNSSRKLKAYVSFKDLEELDASGASDVLVAGSIEAGSFKLNMSGASDFKGDIKATSIMIDLSGASDITISGKSTTVNIESSGASDVNGYGLVTEICNAKASGASDINITVNERMEAHASGASSIQYKGNGVLKEKHTSGASNISRRS